MRDLAFATLLLASLTTPASPDERGPIPTQRLTLVWFDRANGLPRGFEVMSSEVSAIFARMGVEIVWTRGTTETQLQGSELPVTLMPRAPHHVRTGIMGLVNGRQRPPRDAWVFLEAVEHAVRRSPDRFGAEAALQDARLPLAVARVVAHEIFHAVIPEEPHAKDGLMCDKLDGSFLLGARPLFDADGATAFRRGLAALSPAEGSTSSSLLASSGRP